MQNCNNKLDISEIKVIDIKSEILCREAEDDFFYFNNINAAYKKLLQAVSLTPYHLKSLKLLADICFIKGYIKKSFNYYKRAEKIIPDNALILASIANCFFRMNAYNDALLYCEKAFRNLETENHFLFSQLVEIKINILIAQKHYKHAYITFINAESSININSLVYNINYKLLRSKINLQKKLHNSVLKIV